MNSLLSPAANRLLLLLTPERLPIRWQDCDHVGLRELERFGMIAIEGGGSATTIRLTSLGREWGNPAFNN